MRLFVAVELDDTIVAEALRTANELRRRLGASLKLRWVPGENMHVTVRFIGHVPDDRVELVLESVRPAVQVRPFELALGACGVFPPTGPPRVLWIGLDEGLPSLRDLHAEFDRRLLPLGLRPETRPYSAHLTLARNTDASRGSGVAARDAVRATPPPSARGLISDVTVFESRLSPNGPTHVPLFRIPLHPAEAER